MLPTITMLRPLEHVLCICVYDFCVLWFSVSGDPAAMPVCDGLKVFLCEMLYIDLPD